MKRVVTTGIVLDRLSYGEADRIITMITPDHGKLRLMAKGVRKERSKLAGGIELFSISSITFIPGKRDISTLISTRLFTHYGNIPTDINRTMVGYDILKLLHKSTEENCDESFYHLLVKALACLNNETINPGLTVLWFWMQLLNLLGHQPNLTKAVDGKDLLASARFNFDYEKMGFLEDAAGKYNANDIKLLRLLLRSEPQKLLVIKDVMQTVMKLEPLLKHTVGQFVR